MKYLKKSCIKKLNILNILINNNSKHSTWDIYNNNTKIELEFNKTSYLKNNKTNTKHSFKNIHHRCPINGIFKEVKRKFLNLKYVMKIFILF